MLLLRLVIGGLFMAHGAQKLFGWFGGHGPEGTAGMLHSQGFRPAKPHAYLAGVTELGGGLLLATGLFSPLGAAAVVGMMVNAIFVVHVRNGFFNQDGGIEFPLVLAAGSLAVAFAGAGRFSLDAALAWHVNGWRWGLAAFVLGVAAATIVLAMRYPVVSAQRSASARGDRTQTA